MGNFAFSKRGKFSFEDQSVCNIFETKSNFNSQYSGRVTKRQFRYNFGFITNRLSNFDWRGLEHGYV